MKTNAEWQEWGRQDPLYGVATWPGKSRGGGDPWTDEEFYAVGARDWSDFADQWRTYAPMQGRCLEIGCGAGRLTIHIAQTFDEVLAVDVSADMIEYAKLRAPTNVAFEVTDGATLPAVEGSMDAIFSVLVFQHFDTERDVEVYLREAFRAARPGGTIMIQIPVYSWPGSFSGFTLTHSVRRWAAGVRAAFRRRRLTAGVGQPFFRYLRVEMGWLYELLRSIGFADVQLRTFRPSVHPEVLTFMLARKPIA